MENVVFYIYDTLVSYAMLPENSTIRLGIQVQRDLSEVFYQKTYCNP